MPIGPGRAPWAVHALGSVYVHGLKTAIECLRKALRVAPDYADAMFNLALAPAPPSLPGLFFGGGAVAMASGGRQCN
jgi:hypothetical protein